MRFSLLVMSSVLSVSSIVKAYDADQAMRALYLSSAAYCADSIVENWSCGEKCNYNKLTNLQVISHKSLLDSTFAFVAFEASTNQIVVSFRGSQNTQNWITNLNFGLIPYEEPNMVVHQGWYNAYKSVQLDIREAVKALVSKYPTAGVLITGHSLGGALGIFCAADLSKQGISKKILIYTFGQPRVGDERFAKYFNGLIGTSNIMRVVHSKDLVPHMSPFFCTHVGQEIWYKADDLSYKQCAVPNTAGEDSTCSNQFAFTDLIVKDHLLYLGKPTGCKNSSLLTSMLKKHHHYHHE